MQPTELPLKDIHLPQAISWFPPAIGWWLLAIAMLLLTDLFIKFYKDYRRQSALKIAKKQFESIAISPIDNATKLRDLSVLLRRVAISVSGRYEVASLTGQAWLHFLDGTLKDAPFSTGVGRCLADAPYRNSSPSDAEFNALLQLCSQWLKTQKIRRA